MTLPRVIYADPPWPEKGLNVPHPAPEGNAGRADRHYKLMTLKEIKEMKLPKRAKNGWLFLWCPHRKTHDEGIPVLRAWGYKYTGSCFVWVKTQKNDAITRLFAWWSKNRQMLPPEEILLDLAKHGGAIEPVYGMGYYARIAHEVLLIGKKGKPGPPNARNLRSVVPHERLQHSQKPEIFAEIIERYSNGPYTELFARRKREGWTCLGDEL